MSDQLVRAFVFAKNINLKIKNLAKILSALIEVVARKFVELVIEKLITKEKKKEIYLKN